MNRTSRMLAAAVAATAIASGSAVAVTGANAAETSGTARAATPAPHWRIVATFPKQSSINNLAVSGQDSAWAVEYCTKPCVSGNHVILRHWNGKTWQAQPQPANAKHAGTNPQPILATAPGSPVVWAVYDEFDHKTRASVAEWTGKSWAHPTVFPVGTNFQGLAAIGPSALWAFGSREEFGSTPYTVRFNGKSWVQEPSPGLGSPWTAAARSASDIWAQALSTTGLTLAVSHWNGTRWVKQAVPPAPKGAQGGTGGLSGDLVVSGQDSVWGLGYFAFGTTKKTADLATYWLVHWNGKAWSNVRVPYALNESYMAGPLGSDGRGGAWLEAAPAGTSRAYLYHVSAAGHWTRLPVPTLKGATGTEISGFAAIPGTSSVYAYGAVNSAAGERGVILKYGA